MSALKIAPELHRKALELTLALYRVTDFFPQGEPLRRQLREKANEIFGWVTEYGYDAAEQEREAITIAAKIQAMKGYLGIARSVQFVRAVNIDVLEREYESLERFLEGGIGDKKNNAMRENAPGPLMGEKIATHKHKKVHRRAQHNAFSRSRAETLSVPRSFYISERRKKILAYAKQMPGARTKDFFRFFDAVSPKTVQRDLLKLVEQNMLKKQGNKKGALYSINQES